MHCIHTAAVAVATPAAAAADSDQLLGKRKSSLRGSCTANCIDTAAAAAVAVVCVAAGAREVVQLAVWWPGGQSSVTKHHSQRVQQRTDISIVLHYGNKQMANDAESEWAGNQRPNEGRNKQTSSLHFAVWWPGGQSCVTKHHAACTAER
jgi:hypothetical protein